MIAAAAWWHRRFRRATSGRRGVRRWSLTAAAERAPRRWPGECDVRTSVRNLLVVPTAISAAPKEKSPRSAGSPLERCWTYLIDAETSLSSGAGAFGLTAAFLVVRGKAAFVTTGTRDPSAGGARAILAGGVADAAVSSCAPPQSAQPSAGASPNAATAVTTAILFMAISCRMDRGANLRVLRIIVNPAPKRTGLAGLLPERIPNPSDATFSSRRSETGAHWPPPIEAADPLVPSCNCSVGANTTGLRHQRHSQPSRRNIEIWTDFGRTFRRTPVARPEETAMVIASLRR